MDILNILFALMQVAVSHGAAAELSTLAGVDFPMPNLIVVLNNLGFGSLEPRDFPHVRIRICHEDYTNKLRFVIEDILHDNESISVNLDNFWNDCPYGNFNETLSWVWEVQSEDAEKLLLWTMQRGKDIKCPDILANAWSID